MAVRKSFYDLGYLLQFIHCLFVISGCVCRAADALIWTLAQNTEQATSAVAWVVRLARTHLARQQLGEFPRLVLSVQGALSACFVPAMTAGFCMFLVVCLCSCLKADKRHWTTADA